MSRQNASPLWNYFDKIKGTKDAICQLCNEKYNFGATTGNLKRHLRRKHHAAYIEIREAQFKGKVINDSSESGNQNVIYEYIVTAESPTSSINNEQETAIQTKTATAIQSKGSKSSISKQRRTSEHEIAKTKVKRLIEQLTEEKINVTNLQKDLIQKELEEKNIRVLLLQKEMEHKQELYEIEKQEMEHRKQMCELQKQEMLLKIESLKANLINTKRPCPEPDLPTLE